MSKKKKEYTLVDIEQDMETVGQALKTIAERLKAVEDKVESNGDDVSFGSEDKRGAVQWLSKTVISPDEKMLPQMTETPDRLIVPLAVECARNEFIKIRIENPNSLVLFSELLVKWFNIIMRSRNRSLIGEALGLSQIQVDKDIEEESRKLALGQD